MPDIQCTKCSSKFGVKNWRPGMPCPKCKSPATQPITHVGAPQQQQRRSATAPTGWKNSPVVAAIAIIIIVGTWAAMGYWKMKPANKMKVEVKTLCTKCKAEGIAFTDEIPKDCTCGGLKSVYTMYECKNTSKSGKVCGNKFAYIPPSPMMGPFEGKSKENLTDEQRRNMEQEYYSDMMQMMQIESKYMDAMKCPKCKSMKTAPVYTPEQQKRFDEMREEYRKKR